MSGIVHSTAARQAVNFACAVALSSCSTALDSDLDNRACSFDGRCLPGYVCSYDNLCVRGANSRADAVRRLKPKRSSTEAGTPDVAGEGEVLDGGEHTASGPAEPAPNASSAMAPSAAQPESRAGAGAHPGDSAAGSGAAAGPPPPPVDTGGDVTIVAPAQGAAGSTPVPALIAGAGGAPTAGAGGTTAPPAAGAGASATPPPPTAGTGGAAGSGTPPVTAAGSPASECAQGRTRCDSRCVDLETDADNCGECGDSCNDKEECDQGRCRKAASDSEGRDDD